MAPMRSSLFAFTIDRRPSFINAAAVKGLRYPQRAKDLEFESPALPTLRAGLDGKVGNLTMLRLFGLGGPCLQRKTPVPSEHFWRLWKSIGSS